MLLEEALEGIANTKECIKCIPSLTVYRPANPYVQARWKHVIYTMLIVPWIYKNH